MTDDSECILPGCECFQSENPMKRPKGYIPYAQIYENQDMIRKQGYWIPNFPVEARIIHVQKDNSPNIHIWSPLIYTIEFIHGKFKWTVMRRYRDFRWLSQRLLAHRAVERLRTKVRRKPHRVKSIYELDHNYECPYRYTFESITEDESDEFEDVPLDQTDVIGLNNNLRRPNNDLQVEPNPSHPSSRISKRRRTIQLPRFPIIPDTVMISTEQMNRRREKLEAWLRYTLERKVNRNFHETAEFCEVSRYSFIDDLGGKYKEGLVKKRHGGVRVVSAIARCCARLFIPFGRRWLIIKDTYICYENRKSETMRRVLLMDSEFAIMMEERKRELVISNLQHELYLKFPTENDAKQWKIAIQSIMDSTGSVWLDKKRFNSSYPERKANHVEWFVDAKNYMEKAAAMIELAKDEIFITGWWLCPEIFLRRPINEGIKWRFDRVLLRAAKRGVRIFILLYKEVEMALYLASLRTKDYLEKLHKNIKVMRHPNRYCPGFDNFFWTHHEKLLIIDQLIGFVGGIDLCYGRWDDPKHRLTDLGSLNASGSLPKAQTPKLIDPHKLFPGKDYANFIFKDFVNIEDAYSDYIDRAAFVRMPWHDIHSLIYGEAARDLARHFIQRWNATKTKKYKSNENYIYLVPRSYNSIKLPKAFINKDTHKADIQVLRSVSDWSCLIDGIEESIHNAYMSLITNSKHFVYIENQFFVSMINSPSVNNGICKAIYERILRAYTENETFRVFVTIPLLPGFEGDIGAENYSTLKAVLYWTYQSISRGKHSLIQCLKDSGIEDPMKYIIFTGLRTYDELGGKLVTELIYVHSKLMIVDDVHTIIGSANINDRSLNGYRDSEVCIIVTDTEFTPSKMNGQPYQAGKFASSLRKNLMKEHLCLHSNALHPATTELDVNLLDDPVADSFYVDVWFNYAKRNTGIYEDVFRTVPTDKVTTEEEMREWKAESPMSIACPDQARETLKKLFGNIVLFPLDFLKNKDLAPTISTKEGLIPRSVFT